MLGYQFYFNSRTRVRCDFGKKVGGLTCPVLIRTPCEVRHLDCQGNRICQISIRAPVQGATRDVSYADGSFSVLIRAPAQGATFRAAFFYGTGSDFDSRTQVGCDLSCNAHDNVSACFDSRTCVKYDSSGECMQIACDNQQSTGVRFKPCFDSRTRMGATYSSSSQKEESIVLIRVPAQSATRGIFTRVKVCAF